MDDYDELKEIIRVGTVHSVNKSKMTARVKFDEEGFISGELHILIRPDKLKNDATNTAQSHAHSVTYEKWVPKVNDMVLCIMRPFGDGDGFILGGWQ